MTLSLDATSATADVAPTSNATNTLASGGRDMRPMSPFPAGTSTASFSSCDLTSLSRLAFGVGSCSATTLDARDAYAAAALTCSSVTSPPSAGGRRTITALSPASLAEESRRVTVFTTSPSEAKASHGTGIWTALTPSDAMSSNSRGEENF